MSNESEHEEISLSVSGDKDKWLNINDEFVLSRTFIENCVMYVVRDGSHITLRTTDEQNNLTILTSKESEAIKILKKIHKMLNEEEIDSCVDYEPELSI